MVGSPSQISVAVAKPVIAGAVDSSHSIVVSTAQKIVGEQSIDMQEVSTGVPNGGDPLPVYIQLNWTTFSSDGTDSIIIVGSTNVMTTPSSPMRNPPLDGSCCRSQTTEGQKLAKFG